MKRECVGVVPERLVRVTEKIRLAPGEINRDRSLDRVAPTVKGSEYVPA
jgi:hypothetical protein